MAYQVIARKWRPQTFEDVTGQEAITRTLRGAIEHDRLHHAYLFSGARGVGKTTTARLLAKALNCHRADRPTPTPCATTDENACASCREVAEGRSIDVLEIDAASNTGVDNVREAIINTVAVRPARDRYKVFIIDEVHMLSGAAFNALLKTLEEPPPRVVFIMATTEAHKVPDTILSRCQQFEFRTIATSKIAERLRLIADAEKITISDDALREIARAGEGSMRDAQSAFDQVISFSDNSISVEDVETALGVAGAEIRARVMRSIAESAPAEVLAVVDDLVMRGHELRNFCRDLLAHLRDLLVVKVAGETAELSGASESERRELAREAEPFSESDLVRFFHSLTETEKALRESAHPRYQLEIGLVKLIEMRRLVPLSQIVERLAALEDALRTGKAPAGPPGPIAPPVPAGGSNTPRSTSSGGKIPPVPKASVPRADNTAEEHNETPRFRSTLPHSPDMTAEDNGLLSVTPANISPPASPPPPTLKLVTPSAADKSDAARTSFFDDSEKGSEAGPSIPVMDGAQASRTTSPATLIERLKTALEERRKPFLAIALEGARKVSVGSDELYVEFAPEGKHLRDNLAKPDSVRLLRDICRELIGHDIGLRIIVGDGLGNGDVPSKEDEKRLEKQRLREVAEKHPDVQHLLRTFRGEIIDVLRVDSEQ